MDGPSSRNTLKQHPTKQKLPKSWLKGIVVFIPRNKYPMEIQNRRPSTIISIIYKLLDIRYVNRLAPYMNRLSQETQTAYKKRRYTIDIHSISKNQIQNEEKRRLLLNGLPGAFNSMGWNTLRTAICEKAPPRKFAQEIRSGHRRTKLCPRYKENISKLQYNNKGYIKVAR